MSKESIVTLILIVLGAVLVLHYLHAKAVQTPSAGFADAVNASTYSNAYYDHLVNDYQHVPQVSAGTLFDTQV